jgi:hypothetical protein
MKKITYLIIAFGLFLAVVSTARGRDIKRYFPIGAALEAQDLQPKIDGSMKMSFGKETTREGLKPLRNDVAIGKERLRGKTDGTACHSAFLSALVELQKRAKQHGANAVVSIVSYYKKVEMSSSTEYECREGSGYMAVAFRGDFVRITDQ